MIGPTNAREKREKPKPEQEKSVNIYANGDTDVYADEGMTMHKVRIHTDVPDKSLPTETKHVSIQRNHTETEVTPTLGYTMDRVVIRTEIPERKPRLGIEVLTYASASALPGVAQDNTVAVITAQKATAVTIAQKPPSGPKEGAVWISLAASGAYRIGDNDVQLYPVAAYQYSGGKWTVRSGRVASKGAWKAFWQYLFYNGDENIPVTGGWKTTGQAEKKNYGGTMTISCNVSYGQGNVVVSAPLPGGYRRAIINVRELSVPKGRLIYLYANTSQDWIQDGSVELKTGVNTIDIAGKNYIGFHFSVPQNAKESAVIADADGFPGIYLE